MDRLSYSPGSVSHENLLRLVDLFVGCVWAPARNTLGSSHLAHYRVKPKGGRERSRQATAPTSPKEAAMTDESSVMRQSLREQVREEILRRIAMGDLKPGCRIVETRLAAEFGVSPIPVREAIRELVAMGILESAPHKGARVREVTLQETIEAMQIRAELDALAARSAAKRLKGNTAELKAVVERLVEAARARDFAGFLENNQAFHRTIVEASGNSVLFRIWNLMAFEVRAKFILEYLATADLVAIAEEHLAILDALHRGEGAEAAQLLAEHSNQLVQFLHEESRLRAGASE